MIYLMEGGKKNDVGLVFRVVAICSCQRELTHLSPEIHRFVTHIVEEQQILEFKGVTLAHRLLQILHLILRKIRRKVNDPFLNPS